ncbi:sigma-54-dependent Fis family transcriptional regulator [Kaistia dalseonensis]|uniref:Transcriptional regulator of acetoin/glycerol metabolism n=1 Tax=Kaistia dalseonensis TaxID=410840 RepID=A0ABU0H793_9HYPH|nr:sigma-54-dependent Fis family transcriptional regulator [Kaistia dalseonensis]MCX5495579.1 sigma-54-dependent Fis family transcriptional regulator [Kaistia dalseonensis]MDQ0438171.1 transcriptional regulator of acetoin/glycerol metabolism [Kaistia dalseonensis]
MQSTIVKDTVQTARRRFFDEGSLPEGLVAAPILRSWQRCATQGLNAEDKPRVEPLSAPELRLLHERNDLLRRITRPEMAALRAEARLTDSVVILTDNSGLVLDMVGNAEFAGRASRVALRPGVQWDEMAIGTNAIGTALVEKRPIGVHGSEHFFDPHRILTCAAAPIFGPRGELSGVLDMSGHASVRHVHALGLVRLAVEQVEHRLFERGFEDCTVLRFHQDAELVGTAQEAVLVFRDDRLVAANRRGLGFLKLDWSALDQTRLSELFEQPDRIGELGQLRTRTGEDFRGRIAAPEERSVRAVAVAPRASAEVEPFFGQATRAALARAIRLVDADVPVLVHGETGSGKEVFARRIHAGSARSAKPLVAINCAALPEGLIESELFGYEEGAFTGARRRGHEGLLRQADGGILFLDEIGDMPLVLQGRLLRALQDRQVVPLGGDKPVSVDFALLCATHRPLADLVSSGTFRSDLYFRIAQYVVELPPLRDHADRSALIDTLWDELGGRRAGVTLAPETLRRLAAHDWPGNFRQLVGTLRALLALAEPGEPLDASALPADIGMGDKPATRKEEVVPPRTANTLSALTREAMSEALAAHNGNVSRAARSLGIDRTTLYRRLLWRGAQS